MVCRWARGLGCPRISSYRTRNLCPGRSWIAQAHRQAMLDLTAHSPDLPSMDGGDDAAQRTKGGIVPPYMHLNRMGAIISVSLDHLCLADSGEWARTFPTTLVFP